MPRIIVGVSGASGMSLAAALLDCLQGLDDVETHLVISDGAKRVLHGEVGLDIGYLADKAKHVYAAADTAAPPASGSWLHDGMVVCPCSMSTLAAIATGSGRNLLHRAADVCLKERRPLVLVPRETPLNHVHLKNLLAAHEAGAIIMPFCPALYTGATDLPTLARYFVGRICDQLHLAHNLCPRWQGERSTPSP